MNDLPKEMEERIFAALGKAAKLANGDMTPDEALTKVAEDEKFTPQITQRMIEAFNISKTLSHLKKSAEAARAKSFPIADPEAIIGSIWPEDPATAAKEAGEAIHTDYLFPTEIDPDLMKVAKVTVLPKMVSATPEPYATDPGALAKKAIDDQNKLWLLHKQAKDAYREVFFKLYGTVDKAAAYWRRVSPKTSFEEAEKRAYSCFGDAGMAFMDLVYTAGHLGARPLLVKRAEEMPTTQMVLPAAHEPYKTINDAVFLSKELCKLAKEVGKVEATMHEHALCNFDRLPPQPVEAAIDFFLPKEASDELVKEAKKDMPGFMEQDRPAKVKEIYGALKRDKPGMPAEMKARIASRQGKPGKQKQGPPYKGPLSKTAAPLDDLFATA
jgi:hypothetical protein